MRRRLMHSRPSIILSLLLILFFGILEHRSISNISSRLSSLASSHELSSELSAELLDQKRFDQKRFDLYSELAARSEESRFRSEEKQCSVCKSAPELCTLYGEAKLQRAFLYSGTNARLKRFLRKLRSGETFNVGVIGGSVSAGFGLDKWPEHTASNNLHRIIFDHLNDLFPASNGVTLDESGRASKSNGFINGALGGTGTDYFSFCFGEHIPNDVDLVLIELAINDELLTQNFRTFELMVRGLLDLPNHPAVLSLQVFALMFDSIALGGDIHQGVGQLYDIPTISMRNLVLPTVLANSSAVREWFFRKTDPNMLKDTDPADEFFDIDLRHISPAGHKLMADLAIAFIDNQLCELDHEDEEIPLPELPPRLLSDKWDPRVSIPPLTPECFSTNAKKHPLVPIGQTDWRNWNWKAKNYIISDTPGSTITFQFHTSLGQVVLQSQRSAVYGFGSVSCWVDDDRSRAVRVDGYWDLPYNIGRSDEIRRDLEPGEHLLHCELLEETLDPQGRREFRIISVMSI